MASAARVAPPTPTSWSVESAIARASSRSDPPARRALPSTLLSVRLKTTFGRADQTSAKAAPSSSERIDGSVSHTSMVS